MNDDQRTTDRLHAALTEVADRHQPDPAAWHRIHDRLQGGGATLTEVTAAPAGRRRARTRLLAAAAVLVAIAAVGAAVAATRHGDTTKVATTPPDDEATGWYVPVGLPDGWSLTSVTSSRMDEACPCRDAVWANADRSQVITASRSDAPELDLQTLDVGPEDLTSFELGDGVTATRTGPLDADNPVDAMGNWSVDWEAEGKRTSISAQGISTDTAEPIARALFADPDTDDLSVPGLDLVDAWSEDGEIGRNVQVEVMLQAPSGNPINYTLSAPRSAVPTAWSYEPTDRLPDQPLPTLGDEYGGPRPEGSNLPDMPVTHQYLGRWPGATVQSSGFRQGRTGSDVVIPTDAEVETLMSALRPATTEEWRRFVATAGNRDRAVTASATLADLIDQVAAPPSNETATTFAQSDGTSAAGGGATTTAAPAAAGDLADLDLSLSAEPRLASWEDAGVELTVRNPTSTAISDPTCALDHAEVALLPADDATRAQFDAVPAGEPWWSDDGACDGGLTIGPGATKTIRLVVRAQFHDARYGPLPSGTYDATARIAGIGDPATAPVAIVSLDCTNGAEDYVGLTEADARALAGERLVAQIRVPEPGTESGVANDSDRCDRINLILGDDGRVAYARAY